MVGQLDELDEAVVGGGPRAAQPCGFEPRAVAGVHLVAVAVPLGHGARVVDLGDLGAGREHRRVRPEPHGAALVDHVRLVLHEVDDRVRSARVELPRVRAVEPREVARHFDHHHLQPEAEAEAGDPVLACVPGGSHHPLDAPLAEAAGDDDAVELVEPVAGHEVGHDLGVDPFEPHLDAVVEACVAERLHHGEVRVREVHVLADDADADLALCGAHAVDQLLPLPEHDRVLLGVDPEDGADHRVQAFFVQHERDLVDALRVDVGDHRLDRHVAEERDLALQALRDVLVAPADDDVGLDAAAAQLGDRVLRRLGLLLSGGREVGHQREVHVADVLPADVAAELADRLQEGDDLDVADGAPDLDDHDVDVLAGEPKDAVFDLVGDVGDDLDRLAEVVPTALLGDDGGVDGAGRRVGVAAQVLVDEPLVVAEIEVGLTPVFGDEDLAVLAGVHGAGVDVDVGVELAHGDPEPPAFQEAPQRRGGEPLAEGARDPPGDEDELAQLVRASSAPSVAGAARRGALDALCRGVRRCTATR